MVLRAHPGSPAWRPQHSWVFARLEPASRGLPGGPLPQASAGQNVLERRLLAPSPCCGAGDSLMLPPDDRGHKPQGALGAGGVPEEPPSPQPQCHGPHRFLKIDYCSEQFPVYKKT